VIMFMGGWYSPFEGVPLLGPAFDWVPGVVWFALKIMLFLYMYLAFRATFPRYRYDQIMRLGWKVLIPVTVVWLVVLTAMLLAGMPPWFN